MTSEQVELVETSWETVEAMGDDAIALFYETLFEKAPQVRAMFADDMSEQRQKLAQVLGMAVGSLRKLDIMVPSLHRLGAKHRDYGAEPAHYDVVGEALLETLARAFGAQWTRELEAAWTETFQTLAGVMLEGATLARAA